MTKSTWILSAVFLAALLFTGCPNTDTSPNDGNNNTPVEYFEYDAAGNTIIGLTAEGEKQTELTVPATVSAIGDDAFQTATLLESITFKGTPVLGDSVFSGTQLGQTLISSLQNKMIPKAGLYRKGSEDITSGGLRYSTLTLGGDLSAIVIGIDTTGMFDNSNPLWFPASISLDTGNGIRDYALVGIRTSAFQGRGALMDNIVEVRFGASSGSATPDLNSVIEIGDNAFDGISTITKVDFGISPPGGVTIGNDAFKGTALASVLVEGEGYSSVNSAIQGTYQNYEYKEVTKNGVAVGVTVDGFDSAWTATSADFDLSGGGISAVTEIAAEAFADNATITAVTIPNTVTKIGNRAFGGCTDLDTATFEGTPPELGNSLEFDDLAEVYRLGSMDNVFEGTKLNDVHELWSWQVPGDEATSGEYAFIKELDQGNFTYHLFSLPGGERKAVAIRVKDGAVSGDFSTDADYTIGNVSDGGNSYVTDALIAAQSQSEGSLLLHEDLTKVMLPDTLKVIGPRGFYTTAIGNLMTKIRIPPGTFIMSDLLLNQKALEGIHFDGVSKVLPLALAGSSVNAITKDSIGLDGSINGDFNAITKTVDGIRYLDLGNSALAVAVADIETIKTAGELVIPDQIDFGSGDVDVVEIDARFINVTPANSPSITGITFGSNVKKIGLGAMNGFNDVPLVNTGNITRLDDQSFINSKGIETFVLPEVTSIGMYGLWSGSDITFGQDVTLDYGTPFTSYDDLYIVTPTFPGLVSSHVMRAFIKIRTTKGSTIPAGQYTVEGTDYNTTTDGGAGTVYRAFAYDADADPSTTNDITFSASIITGADEAILDSVDSDKFGLSAGTAIPVEVIDARAYNAVTFTNTAFVIPSNVKYIDAEAFKAPSGGNGIVSVDFQGSADKHVGKDTFLNIPGVSAAIGAEAADKAPGLYQ